MQINSTGGNLSHCTHVSNHHMGSLNFTVICVKYTPLKLEKTEKIFKTSVSREIDPKRSRRYILKPRLLLGCEARL